MVSAKEHQRPKVSEVLNHYCFNQRQYKYSEAKDFDYDSDDTMPLPSRASTHAITQAYDPLLAKDLFFNVLVQAIFTGKPENVRLALAVPEIDVNTIHTIFEF